MNRRAFLTTASTAVWIVRGRGAGQVKGEWGSMEIVSKVPASEEQDRTCAEKGHA